jgi:beta-lactamase class A
MIKINWSKYKKYKIVWILTTLILALALGMMLGNFYSDQTNKKQEKESNKELHQKGYKYISPLLECADFHDINNKILEEKINILIEKNKKNKNITYASVYWRDLNNGPWVGINEKENFAPASLLKVPLMIAYLKMSEKTPQILEEKIMIPKEADSLAQNIIPLRTVESGKEYTINDLIEYMIIYSDNRSANTLIDHIDTANLNQSYNDLQINTPLENSSDNFMNVRDYASFFRILYNASYLDRNMSEKALEILNRSQFQQGLSAGLPPKVAIAHKFGERILADNRQLHDCGIVYRENNPYLLCVMTRGQDFTKMSQTIKEISALVYAESN